MALVAAKCTNCGKNIDVDHTKEADNCPYCGAAFIVEKAISNYMTTVNANSTKNFENDTLIKNAETFLKMREYQKAEEQLDSASKIDPSDWRVWFGFIRVVTKDFTNTSLLADKRYIEYYKKAEGVALSENLSELQNLCAKYEKQRETAKIQRRKKIKILRRVSIFTLIPIIVILAIVIPIVASRGNPSHKTFTVTLDNQSGTGGTSSVTVVNGSNMPSATAPTRSGYTFSGYYTETNGGGIQYYTETMGSTRKYDKSTNITLYAYWIQGTRVTLTSANFEAYFNFSTTYSTTTFTTTFQYSISPKSASYASSAYSSSSISLTVSVSYDRKKRIQFILYYKNRLIIRRLVVV